MDADVLQRAALDRMMARLARLSLIIASGALLSGCMVATATMAVGSAAITAGSVAVSAATTVGSAVVSGASATARAVLPGKGPETQHAHGDAQHRTQEPTPPATQVERVARAGDEHSDAASPRTEGTP